MDNGNRTKEEWKKLIAVYEASDLTQKLFSRKHGINYHTFKSMLYQIRAENRKEESVHFIEVTAASEQTKRQPTEPTDSTTSIRLYLTDEVFFDFDQLPPVDYLAFLARSLLEKPC